MTVETKDEPTVARMVATMVQMTAETTAEMLDRLMVAKLDSW